MDTVNVVITGHVDHGKSTFIGRLLYGLGVLTEEKLAKIRLADNDGENFEFAHIMDSFEEEQLFGMTMDTSNMAFRYGDRQFTIIDVPGHYELLAKMVTGANYAEAAILIIDATEGLQRQTKLHCHLLSMMGINQIIILINKMDLVGYNQAVFVKFMADTLSFLKPLDIKSYHVIPISAKYGDNLTTKSTNMAWHSGPTVLSALSSLVGTKPIAQEMCFPVQDVYEFDGEQIIVGRVESGRIFLGQRLLILPERACCTVKEIRKYGKTDVMEADVGECIGIVLEGEGQALIKRGSVITDSEDLRFSQKLKGRMFWLVDKPCAVGDCYHIYCATQCVNGTVARINNRLQMTADNELVCAESVDLLALGEIADITIDLDNPIVFKTRDCTRLSNFVIKRDGTSIVGGGYFHD